MSEFSKPIDGNAPPPHRRRPRYRGKNPRRFEEKYKEHQPERYAETVAKVMAAGKTPAGMHRPIMVPEILEVLAPVAGEVAVDCTLGFGGHAREILERLQPGGVLIGLDADPIELPRTEARLRALGYGPETFSAHRSSFAGLTKVLTRLERSGVDMLLADLGVSSMQIDDPARGFSVKAEGPLDMRMNPEKGFSAAALLEKATVEKLTEILVENADEPRAAHLAQALAGRTFRTTLALAGAIRREIQSVEDAEVELCIRRVFQALRVEVNDELGALDSLLRILPGCLNPGGRVAILSFHSGEDRRVKRAFEAGLADGTWSAISTEVIRPTPEERHSNPRSAPAKMRWARK
ncbi:MAG: 16S rRNA (cytosine(1402)-N(4))-methyltransferase RsmH [Verrucomicrobiae bacterium]|nr:16S rRNA (cytosine(1402)-N(4))-methyltransferase RsmH [Verrucomicrobiae bacterium]